jgi:hypothetical protein
MRVGDAHDLASGASRIGEGAEDVHDGMNSELAPHRADMAHRRMHERCEHEHDPGIAERRHHFIDGTFDPHA